ncbi:MAG: Rpp14/Pop5 family protein [Candidatus Nanohaloarchaea archaeon]
MKRLPPAIQEKQRYLRFRVHCEEPGDLGEVVDAVWDAALGFLGSKGSSNADFWIIGNRFEEEKQEGVIRVNRQAEDDLRAALALVDEIGGEKGFIQVTGVSGTLESLEN